MTDSNEPCDGIDIPRRRDAVMTHPYDDADGLARPNARTVSLHLDVPASKLTSKDCRFSDELLAELEGLHRDSVTVGQFRQLLDITTPENITDPPESAALKLLRCLDVAGPRMPAVRLISPDRGRRYRARSPATSCRARCGHLESVRWPAMWPASPRSFWGEHPQGQRFSPLTDFS
jgi:hypothetical protein